MIRFLKFSILVVMKVLGTILFAIPVLFLGIVILLDTLHIWAYDVTKNKDDYRRYSHDKYWMQKDYIEGIKKWFTTW
jgi:hypothetical protein